MKIEEMKREFLKGNYGALARAFDESASLLALSEAFPLAVGAWVFLGDLERAVAIFEDSRERLTKSSPENLVACQFFLGLGYARRSDYPRARKMFAANARVGRLEAPLISFYVHQGLAFYRFFCGRYHLARRHAQKSYEAAIKNKFTYGEILSRDLLGHTSIGVGEVRLGLQHLNAALIQAEKVGNSGISAAIRITLLKFKAQFGLEPHESVDQLKVALEELAPEDTYSRAEIYLELARQLMIRGDVDGARQVLNNSCDFIYKNQNRRQAATLSFRLSYLLHIEGQDHQALHLLRVAESSLVVNIDRLLWEQMRGLRARIERHLGREQEARELESELLLSSKSLAHAVNERIISRAVAGPILIRPGEDPLGDLIDRVHQRDESCLSELIETGYYGQLRDFFKIPIGSKALIFDLIPGSLTVVGPGRVHFQAKGLNGQLRKIVALCMNEPASKEIMINRIWGHDYDPARHDTLAYAAVTKLRKLLDPFGHWFEYTEAGYRINPDVKVIWRGQSDQLEQKGKQKKANGESVEGETDLIEKEQTVLTSDLNYRQLQIIEALSELGSLNVTECAQAFATSKITASRDLALLHQAGHCRRLGKGPATRYATVESSEQSRIHTRKKLKQ